MLQAISPTSKASLKTQCLLVSNGDVEKAEKLYDFYVKDMPDLPNFDAPAPTWVDNTKNTLTSLFSFIDEHKDGLAQGYDVLRSILGAKGVNLPPIVPSVGQAAANAEPLPPINT